MGEEGLEAEGGLRAAAVGSCERVLPACGLAKRKANNKSKPVSKHFGTPFGG